MIRKSKKEAKSKMNRNKADEYVPGDTAGQELNANTPTGENEADTTNPITEPKPENLCSELNDKYLRLYSDFDNFRKRTLKEKIESIKFASEDIIVKLLPVLDDFERALKAFDVVSDADQASKDGMVLIFNKFVSILNQQGLQHMRTAGESFDTDFHEAITNIPAPKPEQKGKIVDVVENGYLLNGKVIRYAKVVVGS